MGKKTLVELDKDALFAQLGYQPHPGQILVHKSKAPRRVLCTGVRWGKTKCAAMEALAAAMEPKPQSVGWVVAPTYDLAERVYQEIVNCCTEHLRHRIITMREHDKRLLLRNVGGGKAEIRAKSADNAVSLLGEGLDWLVIDEAARLKPMIWESHLSQRLVDKRGWALFLSTPRGKGLLFDLFRRGQGADPDYESWNFPSWNNPLLPRDEIEKERERLPERVFRQEYGGEFVEGAGQVFRYIREAATGDWQEPVPGKSYYAGLDLAKVADFSVLVIMNRERAVVHVDRFNKLDWELQVTRVKAATDRYNRAEVLVDSSGVGEPIYENLRKAGLRVRPYKFTTGSKADLVNNLSLMLEKRQIVLPKYELCPELIDEMEAYEYSLTEAGTIRTNAPGGQHDDAVVSLGLCAWLLRRNPAAFIARWV